MAASAPLPSDHRLYQVARVLSSCSIYDESISPPKSENQLRRVVSDYAAKRGLSETIRNEMARQIRGPVRRVLDVRNKNNYDESTFAVFLKAVPRGVIVPDAGSTTSPDQASKKGKGKAPSETILMLNTSGLDSLVALFKYLGWFEIEPPASKNCIRDEIRFLCATAQNEAVFQTMFWKFVEGWDLERDSLGDILRRKHSLVMAAAQALRSPPKDLRDLDSETFTLPVLVIWQTYFENVLFSDLMWAGQNRCKKCNQEVLADPICSRALHMNREESIQNLFQREFANNVGWLHFPKCPQCKTWDHMEMCSIKRFQPDEPRHPIFVNTNDHEILENPFPDFVTSWVYNATQNIDRLEWRWTATIASNRNVPGVHALLRRNPKDSEKLIVLFDSCDEEGYKPLSPDQLIDFRKPSVLTKAKAKELWKSRLVVLERSYGPNMLTDSDWVACQRGLQRGSQQPESATQSEPKQARGKSK